MILENSYYSTLHFLLTHMSLIINVCPFILVLLCKLKVRLLFLQVFNFIYFLFSKILYVLLCN